MQESVINYKVGENMKLSDKDGIKYLNYLNKVKGLVGLGDWTIKLNLTLATNLVLTNASIATCVTNHYDKIIELQLSKEFVDSSEEEKKNTLIHEMIHSRFNIYEHRVSVYSQLEEEYFCNDVTRGLMKLL